MQQGTRVGNPVHQVSRPTLRRASAMSSRWCLSVRISGARRGTRAEPPPPIHDRLLPFPPRPLSMPSRGHRAVPEKSWPCMNGTALSFVLQGESARARGLFPVRPRRGDIPVALLRVVSRMMKREGQECPSSLRQENGGARSSLPATECSDDLFYISHRWMTLFP